MDFMTAAKTGFSKISDMSGKASRSEFWWYVLAAFLVEIVIFAVLNMTIGMYVTAAVGPVLMTVLLFTATVRRLNDAGKPVNWAYAYFGALLLSVVIYLIPVLAMLSMILSIAILVLAIILIYFLVQPSA